MAVKEGANKEAVRQLKWYQLLLLRVLALLMGLWTRTLRFKLDGKLQALRKSDWSTFIFIFWHNRLFVAPAFFRRYLPERKVVPLVSSSNDGVWLTAFLKQMRIQSVRGSRYHRGGQAVRELIKTSEAGFDIAITPDGSRGPIYDMKAGAVAVAMKTNRPIVLLSFNFGKALRLKSWDRFYLPIPFTSIEVKMEIVEQLSELGSGDSKSVANVLKRRLDAITEDDLSTG